MRHILAGLLIISLTIVPLAQASYIPPASFTAAAASRGSTQSTAFPISATLTTFKSVPNGTGAVLPATPNVVFTVINRGSNALLVYPPLGASMDGGTTNAAVSIVSGGSAHFVLTSATEVYAY